MVGACERSSASRMSIADETSPPSVLTSSTTAAAPLGVRLGDRALDECAIPSSTVPEMGTTTTSRACGAAARARPRTPDKHRRAQKT